MKIRRLLINLALSLGAVLAALLLLELIFLISGYEPLRLLLRDRAGRHLILRESENPELLYEMIPNAEGSVWHTPVKINSHGFRGREYPVEKGAAFRIIAIGDSITFGNYLSQSETYPEQLEAKLNASGRRAEVLNLGCGGYNTGQAVAFLEEKGLQFSPDLVVYGFCLNDLLETSPALNYIKKMQLVRREWLLRFRTVQFLAVRLYRKELLDRLKGEINSEDEDEEQTYAGLIDEEETVIRDNRERLRHLARERGKLPFFLRSFRSLGRLGKLRQALDRLEKLASDNDFEVIVLIIPYLEKNAGGEYLSAPAHGIVRYEAERHGFRVIDMFEAMDKFGFARLRMRGKGKLHPNARGHALIADTLYEYLSPRASFNP